MPFHEQHHSIRDLVREAGNRQMRLTISLIGARSLADRLIGIPRTATDDYFVLPDGINQRYVRYDAIAYIEEAQ